LVLYLRAEQDIGQAHVQVGACVVAFRGTRLHKAGNIQADLQVLNDREAELYFSQRALKHMRRAMRRVEASHPDVLWGYFTTGHSLGGFTAGAAVVLPVCQSRPPPQGWGGCLRMKGARVGLESQLFFPNGEENEEVARTAVVTQQWGGLRC
jgi:hypothetical protein